MNPHHHIFRRLSLFALFLSPSLSAGAAELVAHYLLDGDAQDSGSGEFHGTVNGATFVNDTDRGMVASFDGTSSSIDVSPSGYSVVERPNFQFAIAFWIKPNERDDYVPGGARDVNPLMGGSSGGGVIEIVGQGAWNGMGGSSAYGGVGVNSGGGAGSVGKVGAIDLYDGEWHHVVIQWEDPDGVPSEFSLGGSSDAMVWIDAQLAEDANGQTYNGNGGASPTMVLGGPVVYSNGGAANKYYDGLMSDVQFYDDQLTSDEVESIFKGGTIKLQPFEITDVRVLHDNQVQLTWNSTPDAKYTVFWSTDGTDFDENGGDEIDSQGESTTVVIDNADAPISTSPRLLFRVGRNAG